MAYKLYNPFLEMDFNFKKCFLTGKELQSDEEKISVFPEWILERYSLHEKTFTLLGDGNLAKYKDLMLPCSKEIMDTKLIPFEKEIELAFSEGYEKVKTLPKEKLFQWMGKLVYGILYNDIRNATLQMDKRGERFAVSAFLQNRFKNLHLMLQSLCIPFEYTNSTPFSIEIVRIKYSKDVFNYKDETNNLNFSLGMHDFGIVACLQDNGENSIYHKELMQKIGDTVLHPIQFEELCGRFIYSNYIYMRYPEYIVQPLDNKVVLEYIPRTIGNKKPLFDPWDDEMYGQVLFNYWKPWGLTIKDIHTFPNPPISFLVNEVTDELIPLEAIALPY